MDRRFCDMYRPWSAQDLSINDLNGNKLGTAVYRLMRLFGAYRLYLENASEIIHHPKSSRMRWYFEKKIEPVFSSGGYPGNYIALRDALAELGDEMLVQSEKWDAISLRSFNDWVPACKAPEGVIPFLAPRLSELFSQPSPRLALLGIYLIDLRQDFTDSQEHEALRNKLLSWLQKAPSLGKLSIWGMTSKGCTDLAEADIKTDRIPRNILSPHYDLRRNPMGYKITESSKWASI